MPSRTGPATVVATANVMWTLGDLSAREALARVLSHDPDLVGLQEWGRSRRALLHETQPAYTWVAPVLGGCPVGFRSDRYVTGSARQHLLSRPRRADADDTGHRAWLRARIATSVVLRDRATGRDVCVIDVHLTPGVQRRGAYRDDRPILVARHRQEVRRLARLVARQHDRGRSVVVTGDFNVDGLRLPGLTSAWEGRDGCAGTLGSHRHVDDVHGHGPADQVTLVTTDSDHRAVIARRSEEDRPPT